MLFGQLGRLLEHPLEHLQIDIGQFVHIQAALAELVFAELRQLLLQRVKPRHQIDARVLLAGREPGEEPIALAAGRVHVVVAAEADDRVAPELRFFAGGLLQQRQERLGIGPADIVLDALDEFRDAGAGRFGFSVRHEKLPYLAEGDKFAAKGTSLTGVCGLRIWEFGLRNLRSGPGRF